MRIKIRTDNAVGWLNYFANTAIQGSTIITPLLAAQLGATDLQVGLIGLTYGGSFMLFSLLSGRQSDRFGGLIFIRTGLMLCSIAFAAQIFAYNLTTLILARAGVGLALGITMAALIAQASVSGADMGRFSSMGSLGWITGALAIAMLVKYDYVFILSSLCCFIAFCLTPGIDAGGVKKIKKAGPGGPGMFSVLKMGLPVYASVFLRHLGAMSVWIIFPIFLASIGISQTWIGLLNGINYTVQFFVMRRLEKYNPGRMFTFGQILSMFGFGVFIFTETLWIMAAGMAVIGVAWSCLYVGSLKLVLQMGENKGTASGIFQATLNICNVIGPFLGGSIAYLWGYHGVMIFAVSMGATGLITAVSQLKNRPKEIFNNEVG